MDDALPPVAGNHQNAPISRLIAEVVERCPGERITLGEMAEAFGDRAFGLLILLLCLPGLLPGMASIFGTPMLILGVQMGLGFRQPKLPGFIARQSLKRTDMMRLSSGSSKMLARVERYVRPRPGPFTNNTADKVVGWLTAYAALMLILPGPGTNGPPAFGTIVMSLGVVENDSKVVGIGIVATILANVFATAVLLAIVWFGVEALGYII
ncbi:MAG: exopolysaccharide biosynthesis protein [Roseomonas sp.]|nr:exopolysaccharide biosynthesis protein [Roseomonas sp.]MCA3430395.1 exopolysaccharide biosynthesis protein [Roseomonas sp.]MCA3434641.1 exopolysaccharide biosynthesis protein [Roseomonas sp.]